MHGHDVAIAHPAVALAGAAGLAGVGVGLAAGRQRSARRDIDRLREMGDRIETTMGPDGGYRLDAGAEMPPLLFDDDQALAVAIALRAAPALGADIGEAAVRALATMRQVLPARRWGAAPGGARRGGAHRRVHVRRAPGDRGPRLLDGVDLKLGLVERREFRSGAVVHRYRPA